jgi:hypothetical protein
MYKPKFEKRGLVRAVIVIGVDRCACIDSTSREDAEKCGNIWATGIWRRDDEKDLQALLDSDFKVLEDAYHKICGNRIMGYLSTYEYKEYQH